MHIREAEVGDEESIAKDFWHPLGKEMEKYSELNKLKDDAAEIAVDGFRNLLEEDGHRLFLLNVKGEDVGYLHIEIGRRESRENDKYLAIIDLYVIEGQRSKGYGTYMIEEARSIARDEDCDYVMISSEWHNKRARSLYKDLGFEEKKVTFTEKLD